VTISDIEKRLRKIGFKKFKKESSKTISILVEGNRIDALEKVEKDFVDLNAKYDPNKGSSSIGAVVADGFTIKARPASKQGKNSAGLGNEDAMINGIEQFTKGGPITVCITDGRKKHEYKNVIGVEEVGRDTTNRKKADVRLMIQGGGKIPISIKKDNAEIWESADSYYAPTAKRIVDREERKGSIVIEEKGPIPISSMQPNLAIKATSIEKRDVVFGSDLLNKGFVVVRSFRGSDFKMSGDMLYVYVTQIIDKTTDLTGNDDVFFLIRNDSSRKGSKIRPGLRVLAVKGTRINKNVKVVRK